MFALSSLERLRRYIELEDSVSNNRFLTNFLLSTSKNIQRFLNRELKIQSYTEYFDVETPGLNYYPKGYPVSSITSLYADSTGLYDGSEYLLTDYYIGSRERSIVIDYPITPAQKGLRAIYTGGLAVHGTQSVLALTGVGGTFTKNKFVTGSLSGSIGIIVNTTTATPITVETLMGEWEVGDVLTSQSTEGSSTNLPGVTGTVSEITSKSLVESNPEIVQACEMQVRYDWKHKDDYENAGVNKDSTSFMKPDKALNYSGLYQLRPEVRSLLMSHRRISL